jgi:hypothetical protein
MGRGRACGMGRTRRALPSACTLVDHSSPFGPSCTPMASATPARKTCSSAIVLALTGLVVVACRGGEAPGPVEPVTVECPTSGERSCRDASDCGGSLHCTGGHCFANQAGCPCSDVGDCGNAAHCTRGQCYANQAGSPCAAADQCGPRAHCTVDTCYANTSGSPCTENTDCGPSSACVSGKCN